MVFLERGRSAENIEEKIKTDRRKTLINEDKEKRRIQGKSSNNNEHLWFYLFYKKLYFTQKHSSKGKHSSNVVYTITFYLQFLCVVGYLKRSNDTPEPIYTNVIIII